uniref:Uncharacterized protein n=1 Tax=Paramoeba aestuarina TaxID=180227 RepID=A0A7S4KN96_9EUKA
MQKGYIQGGRPQLEAIIAAINHGQGHAEGKYLNVHLYPQLSFLKTIRGAAPLDYVGRMEHIDEDLSLIFKLFLNEEYSAVPEDHPRGRTNTDSQDEWNFHRSDLTPAEIQTLEQIYRMDTDCFGDIINGGPATLDRLLGLHAGKYSECNPDAAVTGFPPTYQQYNQSNGKFAAQRERERIVREQREKDRQREIEERRKAVEAEW